MARGRRRYSHCREVSVAAAFALVAGNWQCARAWRTWGTLPQDRHFVEYVGKFCFDYSKVDEAGLFRFTVEGLVQEAPVEPPPTVQPASPCWGPCDPSGGLYLVVYDDEKAHWRSVHKEWATLTCKERLQDASWATRLSPLPVGGALNRTVFVSEKIRPRFWYFSFVSCGVQEFLKPVEYHIHTENILLGSQHEFGVDHEGMLALHILFTITFVVFSVALRVTTAVPGRTESFRARPLLRLLVLSGVSSAVGSALLSAHYFTFMNDGVGLPLVEVGAVIMASISKGFLSMLQLLMAKGWVLFFSAGEIAWRRFTVCTIGAIIIASAACEVHGKYSHDWRTTLYLYESWPGLFYSVSQHRALH